MSEKAAKETTSTVPQQPKTCSQRGRVRFGLATPQDTPKQIVMARPPHIPQARLKTAPQKTRQDIALAQLFQSGMALHQQGQLAQARAIYEKVLAAKATHFDALHYLGVMAFQTGQYTQALAWLDRAIHINPRVASAHNHRGFALQSLRRLDEALDSYDRALALNTPVDFLPGLRLYTQMQLGHWDTYPERLKALEAALPLGAKVSVPFYILSWLDTPHLHLHAAKTFTQSQRPPQAALGAFKARAYDGKIRIAYYSSDFCNHAVSYLVAELFESHDRQQFEVYAMSFGLRKSDEMRHRIASAIEHFIDVAEKTDLEVAKLSRELGIDIAIDLNGFTTHARTGIFAYRCAPVQVNYLGYPGSMGAPYIDYIIADQTIIPETLQQYYTEKIVYLPHSYQANDSKRIVSDRRFTRPEVGLPENAFVFCCFNNIYKILPDIFTLWLDLLRSVPGSVLWLLDDNPTAVSNLRKEAEARGIDPTRLVFAQKKHLSDHLARHRLADLFLDTFPYNAHTTASDALWAGLPVITLMGQSFASRVGASLLNALDLPELITKSKSEFFAKALEFANDQGLRSGIRDKLAHNRTTKPLFKGWIFAKHLEKAYFEMHQRYVSGSQPEHIHIAPMA